MLLLVQLEDVTSDGGTGETVSLYRSLPQFQ
jgi:hypothetical protein